MTIASCNSNSLSNARNSLANSLSSLWKTLSTLRMQLMQSSKTSQDSLSNPSGKSTSTNQVKLDRFRRVFPNRVEKVREALRILGNCSSNNYEWNERQVKQCFGLLFREFIHTAALFGITVTAQVNGTEIRTLDR